MNRLFYIATYIIACMAVSDVYGQSPGITYVTPQSYTLNTPITPLKPANSGGAVPATVFGQVTTFATGFNDPQDVKMDAGGNFYVADAKNNVIRKISPAGVVSIFAGTGIAGSVDGPAALASFNGPSGIAISADGTVFVADRNNHTIRKIANNIVTTLAGKPGIAGASNSQGSFASFNLPTEIAIDALGGLVVTDYGNNLIRHVAQDGNVATIAGSGAQTSLDGKGSSATFNQPYGVTIGNDGTIYITDDSHIRTIDGAGNVVTIGGGFFPGKFEGTGKGALFDGPTGIVIDAAGNLYLNDANNYKVRRFDVSGSTATIAGNFVAGYIDGTGPAARFNKQAGLCIDAAGNIYLADEANNVIRKVVTTGYSISPNLPAGLLFDSTTGIISGTPAETIQATSFTVTAYNTTGQSAFTISIEVRSDKLMPQTIVFGPLGVKTKGDVDFSPGATSNTSDKVPITYTSSDLSVAVISNGSIHIIGPGNVTITAFENGTVDYAAASPVSQMLTVLPPPDFTKPDIYPIANVALPLDATGNIVVQAAAVATIVPKPNTPALSTIVSPQYFNCKKLGAQMVTISSGYGPDPANPLNALFDVPLNLSFDASSGNLYIADGGNYKIRRYGTDNRVMTLAGGVAGSADGKGANAQFFNDLLSVTNDSKGNTFVSDVNSKAIRKISSDGTTITFGVNALTAANGGNVFIAQALAIDKNDNIFAADKTRIFKINPNGSIATLFAGSGLSKNIDGIGALASFSGINGLTFDKSGNLYVITADNSNGTTIRKITPAGVVTTLYTLSPGSVHFTSLVIDSKNNIFIASADNHIYEYSSSGNFTTYTGINAGYRDGDISSALFKNPEGIAIDPADNLYIADSDNHLIRKITPDGDVTTYAGSTSPGDLDNTKDSNANTIQVPVTVVSTITVTKYSDTTLPTSGSCNALLPDYLKDFKAASSCPATFEFKQSPAAGTLLTLGQVVHVILTATAASINNSATSEFNVTVQNTAVPPPTISITPDFYDSCAGLPVSYTAKAANAGLNPVYQWQVNGINVYAGGPVFTSSTLITGDKITCMLTNTDGCAPVSITSNQASLSANAVIGGLAVSIQSSLADPVCPGSPVTYTATAANTSAVLHYQWQVNGNNKGSDNPVFTTYELKNGDNVACVLTSTGKCIVNPIATSNVLPAMIKTIAECEVHVNNTFTPNNDGVNDLWEIPDLAGYPACRVSVYTRYGSLVFQSLGYSKPWNAIFNGSNLAAGTYYYIIDLKTGAGPLSGPVTVIR